MINEVGDLKWFCNSVCLSTIFLSLSKSFSWVQFIYPPPPPSLNSFLSLLTSDPGNPDLSAQDTDASGAATSNIPLTDEDRLTLAYVPDEESEWLAEGREEMTQRLVTGLEALSQLHFAGPFVYPVNVNEYPDYWSVVPYPTDLNTVREKLLNKYYR